MKRSDENEHARRLARIEANARQVNEAIEAGTERDQLVCLCECGNLDCGTTLPISRRDYEAVRTSFDRFLIAPGHELPAVESVVEMHPAFAVVEKRDPHARELVKATDPRGGV
jgi:hypothetical protein